jgi:hypothetical protein
MRIQKKHWIVYTSDNRDFPKYFQFDLLPSIYIWRDGSGWGVNFAWFNLRFNYDSYGI